jgi:glycosyltransferase involved in cell wall biosynthesis
VPIIAISQDQASRAGDLPIAAVIHHGLDLDRFPIGGGEGDEDGEFFLFLGRMAPEKGARRAALAVKEGGGRLIIAAKMREPWEHQFFHEQVEPLLDHDIVYVGEVGHEEKVLLLRRATALVNPILWSEPFGLVMIEALACGTPVLAFSQGSAPEIVEDGVTGFLCDGTSELVQCLGKVHDLDRSACRADAETRFTTERMVANHVALFQRVVEERSR